MTALSVDPAMSAVLELVVKATVLLAIAAGVYVVSARRASAESRHLVLTLAIIGLLCLPVLSLALPGWSVVTRTDRGNTAVGAAVISAVGAVASAEAEAPIVVPGPSGADAPVVRPTAWMSWPNVLVRVYAAGVLVMLLLMALRWMSVGRLARQASEVQDPDWQRLIDESAVNMGIRRTVRLLRSRERSMPMALGLFRSAIVIPVVADTWEDNRRRAVIRHELAHVARYDCLTQTLAFAACAVYWLHPGAWWVARRLRVERELACDDRVIAAGTEAREYAGHLLEIAYAFGRHRAPALAVSMARPRQLEQRMLAALDDGRNRGIPAIRMRIAGAAAAAALLIPLASATTSVVAAQSQTDRAQDLTPAAWQVIESARAIIRATAASFGVSQDRLPGTWEIRPTKTEGTVHLRMVELNSSSGSNVPIQQLEGLTMAQLAGSGGPIQFRMRRDAGTFTFAGVIRNGVGAGTFSFAPDPDFAGELAKRGFARPSALEQYQMARHDVGYAFLDELNKQGYGKPSTADLVRAGQHGVNFTYLRDMGALGHRLGSLDPLITLRDHGVTPDYVRQLADQGYRGLSADALREARDHGVSPEYVRELRQLGHGIPIDELVRARDHGVSQDYVRGMRDAGYGALTMDQLIKARDHGVRPEYARELKALGYDKIPIDDLVSLRDHGVTPDHVRRANEQAGTRLPLDMIKRIH